MLNVDHVFKKLTNPSSVVMMQSLSHPPAEPKSQVSVIVQGAWATSTTPSGSSAELEWGKCLVHSVPG